MEVPRKTSRTRELIAEKIMPRSASGMAPVTAPVTAVDPLTRSRSRRRRRSGSRRAALRTAWLTMPTVTA